MRKRYFVTPRPDGAWNVKAEGSLRASAIVHRKLDAIETARELASKYKLSQVVVQRQDGIFQTEYTYGKDPKGYPG